MGFEILGFNKPIAKPNPYWVLEIERDGLSIRAQDGISIGDESYDKLTQA